MKPAICATFDYAIPFDQMIAMIRTAGFEVVSFGGNPRHSGYLTAGGRAEIRKLLEQNDMEIDSIHAPFPEGDRLFSADESERLESIRQCQAAMDAAAELNGRIVVIHLIQPYGIPQGEVRDRMVDQGRRSVGALATYAADRGVKLALENGQRREYDRILIDFLAEFDGDHVGFCYDSGHENVQGTCFALLEQLAHRLLTFHIHDNSGSDTHVLPFEGTIDWGRFREVLQRLHYSGNLLLEVDVKNSQFKDHASFLAQARKCSEMLTHGPVP
ncbi:MAG: sugar phosphate isomerase/epimerase [Lentisphaerae bacterium]|jgi:sugar phosphate isomerase/epimerase|nr:sugar phosphate isomerase/epimerase [Lentisphaerota bacterium]MBT4820716.1 sugar phosphate isomerase/epimerase [Lentisphaerota bacterium]MBT5609645.1 sugar phosphate isomerase/epimerase [Lentisphaerota bacterium]MBT7055245.1 sugar phosphate isomerase/epimerase [Lentisphaerota bacterium]MBT7841407.1 sugar phosphate isomerase/epimerase [Lentisphaerota bacterium]